MQPGDRVEYAAHPVSHHEGFEYVHPLTREEVERELEPDHPHRAALLAGAQDWRPATVLDVMEHGAPFHDVASPAGPAARHTERDVVVKLQADDGQPPFDLNVKLVRPLEEGQR